MIKKLLIIISIFLFIGCASGGTECPDRDILIKYQISDGIKLELIEKGKLKERAVISEKECKELLEKYKKERK